MVLRGDLILLGICKERLCLNARPSSVSHYDKLVGRIVRIDFTINHSVKLSDVVFGRVE